MEKRENKINKMMIFHMMGKKVSFLLLPYIISN